MGTTNLEPSYDNVIPNDGHHTIPNEDFELDNASEAGSSRLIRYDEHVAAENEQEQAAAGYPSNLSSDSSYNPIDANTSYEYSSSNNSRSTGSTGTSTGAELLGTPPRYPMRQQAAPSHLTTDSLGFATKLTRGYHKAFTSIMMRESACTVGVSTPIESVLMTKAARFNPLTEFTYATMLDGANPKNLPRVSTVS